MGIFKYFLYPFLFLSGLAFSQNPEPILAIEADSSSEQLYPVLVDGLWGYMDDQGAIAIAPQYHLASFFHHDQYGIVKKGSKYGLVNTSSDLSIKCKYDSIIPVNDSLLLLGSDDHWRISDLNGSGLLKEQFDSVVLFPTHLKLYNGGKCGLYDLKTHLRVRARYDNLKFFNSGYIMATLNGQLGVIDESEFTIIPFKYSRIHQINDTLTAIGLNNEWGLISNDRKCIIQPRWTRIDFFGTGYIKGIKGDSMELCKYPRGDIITDRYDDYFECGHDFITTRKGVGIGVINEHGEEILAPVYDEVQHLYENFFSVKSSEGYGIINVKGDTILPLHYRDVKMKRDFRNVFFTFYKGNKQGLVNMEGQILVPPKYHNIILREKGGFKVVSGRYEGFYGSDGKLIFEAKYHVIGSYGGNTIQARYDNCYALANRDTLISEAINDKIVVANNVAKLYRDSLLEVIELTSDGRELDRYEYYGIDSYSVAVRDELIIPPYKAKTFNNAEEDHKWRFSQKLNKWGLFNQQKNKWAIEPSFDRIHETAYTQTTLTEVYIDPISVIIGGLKFTTVSLYGVVFKETASVMMKPEYVYVQIPGPHSHVANTTSFDFGIHKDGPWHFVSGSKEDNVDFIGPRVRNLRRMHRDGFSRLGPYEPKASSYSVGELVKLITDRGTAWIDGKQSQNHYLDDKLYINCFEGSWPYLKFNINKKSNKGGNVELLDFHWSSRPNLRQMVMARAEHQYGVLATSGDAIIGPRHYSVKEFNFGNRVHYVLGRIEPKFGFVDMRGSLATNAGYDALGNYSEGLASFYQSGNWGYLNQNNKVQIPAQYSKAEKFQDGLAVVKTDRYYGAIDTSGSIKIPFIYQDLGNFKNGIAIYRVGSGRGIVKTSGEEVVKARYKRIEIVSGGQFAIVKNKKTYGLINMVGEVLIPTKYKQVGTPGETGGLFVKKGKLYALYNSSGKRLTKFQYRSLKDEHEGLLAFKKDRYYGYMDSKGITVIDEQFSNAYNFSDGLAKVKVKKNYGCIDKSGKFVVEPKWKAITDFNQGYAVALGADTIKYLISRIGKVLSTLDTMELVTSFSNNVALARGISGLVYFVNPHGEKVVGRGFEDADNFIQGLAAVKVEGKWGVIDSSGKAVLNPQYYGISGYQEGYARITVSPLFNVADRRGDVYLESDYEKVIPISSQIIYVEKNRRVGYVRPDGSLLWKLRN